MAKKPIIEELGNGVTKSTIFAQVTEEIETTIWEELGTTDPNFTKGFKVKGGFAGTSINPMYGIKKLTEVFGPCGSGWGTRIQESRFDKGCIIGENQHEVIHTLIIELWYDKDPEKFVIGVGTTVFVGVYKSSGPFTDGEFFKKTMTDAITNAGKMLGLSADIFLGRYENNKYVAALKEQFKEMPQRSAVNKVLFDAQTPEKYQAIYDNFVGKFGENSLEFLSGKRGNKTETWADVFEVHRKRVNGENPFDANEIPEENQDLEAELEEGFLNSMGEA